MDAQKTDFRFVRSNNGVILGVCSGLAKAFEVEVWVIRLAWIVSILWFGAGIFMYLLLAYTLPRSDKIEQSFDRKFLGVCARISKRYHLEIGVVRTATALLALSSFGLILLIYIGVYLFMPDSSEV